MSHRVKNKREAVGTEPNNACPCGSGLKYKKCCGYRPHKVTESESLPGPTITKKPKSISVAQAYCSSEDVQKFMSRIERMALRGW